MKQNRKEMFGMDMKMILPLQCQKTKRHKKNNNKKKKRRNENEKEFFLGSDDDRFYNHEYDKLHRKRP